MICLPDMALLEESYEKLSKQKTVLCKKINDIKMYTIYFNRFNMFYDQARFLRLHSWEFVEYFRAVHGH